MVALLLVDVINDMDFPGSEPLVRQAVPMAHRLAALKERTKQAGIPAIYINDNFGQWRSDFRRLVDHCTHDAVPGREVARILKPSEDDYFVLKPKHSAFYSTALELLLQHLETRTLIISGMATESCVLFTANDAYLRNYRIIVPADCVASARAEDAKRALDQMRLVLKADVRDSDELDW